MALRADRTLFGIWQGSIATRPKFFSEAVMRRYAKDEEDLEERVAAHLKAQIKAAGITYAQLVERLKRHGYADATIDSIKKKLMRGTFSAGFFLATLAALGVENVSLKDI